MSRPRLFALALLLDLLGSAGALLVSLRDWQVVTTPRPRPLADDVLALSGRTVDAAPTALALVALAGVVAVLATRSFARRAVGAVIALAGAGLVWRAVASSGAVGATRARALVTDAHPAVSIEPGVTSQVAVTTAWPVLTGVGGALVLAAGVMVALRGHRWQAMSSRYERSTPAVAPDPDDEGAATRHAASLWNALDRGEDPTEATAPGAAGAEPAVGGPAEERPGNSAPIRDR